MLPPTINQALTFLYTRDLVESHQFYAEVIGLEMVLDQGSCRIYRAAHNAFLGFCERAEAPTEPKGIIFTFVTEDVDGWHTYLVEKGVEITKPPTFYAEYNIYHIFARDPNGYDLEFQRFLDPGWPSEG